MKLSNAEEILMDLIWTNRNLFFKDIIDKYPDPKPASTTVATLLKRMQEKGFVGYKIYGNSREYYPLVQKSDYFSKQFNSIIKNYFGNSAFQFASYFTTTSNLTTSELRDLKKIVDQQIKEQDL